MKGYQACQSIVRLFYIPTFQSYFVDQSSFLRLKTVSLRQAYLRGITIAAEIGQTKVNLKLEVK